jgi:hypothetical protein
VSTCAYCGFRDAIHVVIEDGRPWKSCAKCHPPEVAPAPVVPRDRPLTKSMQAIALMQQGMTQREAARAVGISDAAVSEARIRLGIEYRKPTLEGQRCKGCGCLSESYRCARCRDAHNEKQRARRERSKAA